MYMNKKMNIYCIKCLRVTNDNNIDIKRKINEKINLYFNCIG